eukprot:CAMPEP_0117427554 /NCGR_PEP_ID=MMETSP0758-20121206/7382_1 /TAXON_ID=63605 /ORGANISM="Percolomonas cosmopolitus, Strain AE-1 (ATCC 50343)" /LENGTH=307 /DNA_ID=CAMNT_0005213267 /DNA_START=637 /DNA_END=1560 /DNA_ORIENTATION=-
MTSKTLHPVHHEYLKRYYQRLKDYGINKEKIIFEKAIHVNLNESAFVNLLSQILRQQALVDPLEVAPVFIYLKSRFPNEFTRALNIVDASSLLQVISKEEMVLVVSNLKSSVSLLNGLLSFSSNQEQATKILHVLFQLLKRNHESEEEEEEDGELEEDVAMDDMDKHMQHQIKKLLQLFFFTIQPTSCKLMANMTLTILFQLIPCLQLCEAFCAIHQSILIPDQFYVEYMAANLEKEIFETIPSFIIHSIYLLRTIDHQEMASYVATFMHSLLLPLYHINEKYHEVTWPGSFILLAYQPLLTQLQSI